MKVHFSQFYIEPGIDFPFSHLFQHRLSEEVESLVTPSPRFICEYGTDFELMFRISAKEVLQDNELRGPTVFRETKDVEFTVFLPFDVIMRHADAPRVALKYLLKGACEVFERLEIDTTRLIARQQSVIDGICADPTMLEKPSWDEAENQTRVRRVFTKFFETRNKR